MNRSLLAVVAACCFGAQAEELRGTAVGVRVGASLNDRTDDFRQVSGTAEFDLPWAFNPGADLKLQTRADVSLGWLEGENEHALVGTAGPSVILSWRDFPLSLEGGSHPTLISRHHFGERDFGGVFQFTTHAGLNWDVTQRIRVSYRYQHMSNAGISRPNPGLNLHLLGVSFRF